MKKLLIALFSVFAMANANAATYGIDWTGSAGYTLTGLLSFNDALLGTGVINETQIDDLSFEVFQGATSQGTWGFLTDGFANVALDSAFNVNFDTNIGQFVVGGLSASASGQNWNSIAGNSCVGVGFSAGSASEGICVAGSFLGSIPIGQSTLNATPVSAVPVPAALFLFAPALLGFFGLRRKVTATA
ncbi:MAG: hypothetical protein COA63_000485 [Methylophaga sp.]|nr:hypothetical protein [Methylophaga sp.]